MQMGIHLTKEELQECQRASGLLREESTTTAGKFLVWMDFDSRGRIILYHDDGNDTPYLQSEKTWIIDDHIRTGGFIFNEGVDFERYDWPNGVYLSESELEAVDCGRGCDHLEGWSLETHTDDGDFDAEKGAMTNFEVSLYDDNGDYMGTGTGTGRNYYTAVGGAQFYEGIDFVKPEEDPEPTEEQQFAHDVFAAMHGEGDKKTQIWKLKKMIEEYEG